MPFLPGDQVHVALLGSGIVREVRRNGRYVIELKGRAVVVEEGQLSRVDQRKRRSKRPGPSTSATTAHPPNARTPSSLDLHGMTSIEAVAALDAFVNDAIIAGHAEIHVIHGRSGRTLKGAVHARLRALPVRDVRIDPANPGVTIVML